MHESQHLLLQIKESLEPEKLAVIEAIQRTDPKNDLLMATLSWLANESDLRTEDSQIYQFCAIVMPWRFGKLVLSIDPQLASSLENSEMESIPASVLERLPFHFFYIELSGTAPKLLTKDGEHQAFGTFVRYLPDSVVADGHFLSFALGFHSILESGEEVTLWQPLHIGGANSLSFAESLMVAKELAARDSIEAGDPSLLLSKNRALLCYLMRIIAYLCSKNSDYQAPALDHSPVKTRRGLRAFESKTPTHILVGANIGNQIRLFKQQKETIGAKGILPHVRRSHFALFHTGHGRTKQELIWRSEAFVNAAEPAVPIVRAVS